MGGVGVGGEVSVVAVQGLGVGVAELVCGEGCVLVQGEVVGGEGVA